jgi:hypothetical protein
MEILVNRMWANRGPLKSRYSIGRLSINGKYQCNTLELPTEDLDGKDKTGERGYAIPYGEYKIKKRFSPKFKRYVLWITKNPTFNSRYILDVLKNIEDETIRVEVNGGQGPCIIKPVEGDGYIYLILPIRR